MSPRREVVTLAGHLSGMSHELDCSVTAVKLWHSGDDFFEYTLVIPLDTPSELPEGVYKLSFDGRIMSIQLHRYHEPCPRRRRLSDRLLAVPLDHDLVGSSVQPQQHAVPLDGSTHIGGLRCVSRKQQLHHPADGMHRVPSGGLQQHHQSEPRRRRLPDQLLAVPFDHELGRGDVKRGQKASPLICERGAGQIATNSGATVVFPAKTGPEHHDGHCESPRPPIPWHR